MKKSRFHDAGGPDTVVSPNNDDHNDDDYDDDDDHNDVLVTRQHSKWISS